MRWPPSWPLLPVRWPSTSFSIPLLRHGFWVLSSAWVFAAGISWNSATWSLRNKVWKSVPSLVSSQHCWLLTLVMVLLIRWHSTNRWSWLRWKLSMKEVPTRDSQPLRLLIRSSSPITWARRSRRCVWRSPMRCRSLPHVTFTVMCQVWRTSSTATPRPMVRLSLRLPRRSAGVRQP